MTIQPDDLRRLADRLYVSVVRAQSLRARYRVNSLTILMHS
jgi:hypothetical protein